MKVDIQAAVSADGFITDAHGGTDWVRDLELYEQLCRQYGCIVSGRATYDEFGPAFNDVQQIVLSSQSRTDEHANIHFVSTVEQALAKAQELGFDNLLVIGGGRTNGAFMRAGVVNKLMLDIHPLILGQGKQLLGDFDGQVKLRLDALDEQKDFISVSYVVERA